MFSEEHSFGEADDESSVRNVTTTTRSTNEVELKGSKLLKIG